MRFLAILLLAVCAQAAVVEGVVLDEETGNPLARTQVALIPLPGTPADITPVRTGARGSFVILSVRPGWYVLRATRRGYAPTESGQLKPGRPGHAFQVADDRASGFLEIHMSHLPAITGTVLDENGLGIPRWTVHIYTAHQPVRHIGQTETDDRGNYRIGELDPGSYLLRSTEGHFEDETPVLATYSKTAIELKDAFPVTVRVGETLHDVNIRPVKGRLLTLSGMFLPPPYPGGAALTLITDTGRREIASGNKERPFSITGVQPGPIELIVKGNDGIGNDGLGNDCGSYARLAVDKDVSTLRLACNPIGKGSPQVVGATLKSPLIARRVDLDGVSETHPVERDEVFRPGHWEIAVPPGDYYTASVRNSGTLSPQVGAWFGFDAGSYTRLVISLSTRTATISGLVSTRGSSVAGAPIFLTNTRTGQTWSGRSDPQGNYSMGGLGPGAYSIVCGFDLDLNDGSTAQKTDVVYTTEGNTTMHALEMILP